MCTSRCLNAPEAASVQPNLLQSMPQKLDHHDAIITTTDPYAQPRTEIEMVSIWSHLGLSMSV